MTELPPESNDPQKIDSPNFELHFEGLLDSFDTPDVWGSHYGFLYERQRERVQPSAVLSFASFIRSLPIDFMMSELDAINIFTDEPIPEEYKAFVASCIKERERELHIDRILYIGLQLIIIVGAAVVTIILSAIPAVPKLVPATISGIVTIATGITTLFKPNERCHILEESIGKMSLEYNHFHTGRQPYDNKPSEEAVHLFMDRTEDAMQEEIRRFHALKK